MSEGAPRPEPDPQDRTYNGWANYPTWAVHLWLSNTEADYRAAQDLARHGGEGERGGDRFRQWIKDENPLADAPSVYSELLGWAIQAVDWDAVARAFAPEDEPPTAAAPPSL